ncbi:MAG TPA: ferrochelatase [Anaerolineales bacterium]|nr:ferrochelatase [Anaerolineales bacterium]
MSDRPVVLVMAYGGPDRMEDVEPYLLDVRGGRPLPPPALAEIKRRYQLIGGRSPIRERTQAQAEALQTALASLGVELRVHVGMRHWKPSLAEAARTFAEIGVRRVVGLVMAPHYSRMSVELYFEKLAAAVESAGVAIEVEPITSWKDDPGYLAVVADRIRDSLGRFPPEGHPELIFTAHSLPERILSWDDPYPGELKVTYDALRGLFPEHASHFAYQSAAMTPEPWLGPDVRKLVEQRAREGSRDFLVVPIGFVSEHVEILYDIDIDLRKVAEGAGARLERIEMPGADPRMMESLARRVRDAAAGRGWL